MNRKLPANSSVSRSDSVAADQGFSLIEALVSLAILAVGMLAVMTMQTATLRANLNNQNLLMAQEVVESAIEWVRTSSDTQLTVATDLFPTIGENSVSGLDSEYQFSGLSTVASNYPAGIGTPDFVRFVGERIRYVQDPNRPHVDRLFVVRVAVEKDYRTVLSRCAATVYWLQDGDLTSFDVIFFVERKT